MEREQLVQLVRELLVALSPDQRLELIDDILDGYCHHCGLAHDPCYCMDDE